MNTVTPAVQRRCFGIIPAAGESSRMGTPKLLLRWSGATVMEQVLHAWTESLVRTVVVVVRKQDVELQKVCLNHEGVELVTPRRDPPDMKRSVLVGLEHIAAHHQPTRLDRWLVAPADLPTMTTSVIDQVVQASQQADAIVVPQFGDRRGHPVSFPWSVVPAAFALNDQQGINALVKSLPVDPLSLPADEHPDDLDTPADYARLSAAARHLRGG